MRKEADTKNKIEDIIYYHSYYGYRRIIVQLKREGIKQAISVSIGKWVYKTE